MTRRSLRGSRAIVTGASGGIGRELALELARRGTHLILTARRADQLEAARGEAAALGVDAIAVAGDVTQAETREKLCALANSRWSGLDILINNAGVGALGRFEDASPDRLRQIMEVNFFAPVELSRLALPVLRKGVHPIIVNVGSILGHRGVPGKSEYCASKFALHGFSDSLRAELSATGIEVLLVSPGTTDSEFFDHVLEGRAPRNTIARPISPARVARIAVRAIESGAHEIILPAAGRLLVWLDRLCPPLANWLVAKYG